jgi:hypothetical protein
MSATKGNRISSTTTKSLKIPKRKSEVVNRRRTEHTTDKKTNNSAQDTRRKTKD